MQHEQNGSHLSETQRDSSGGDSSEGRESGSGLLDGATDADFDALAGLYLGDAPERGDGDPPVDAGTGVRIEAMLLGHLPVGAAAWPGQHARVRAAELGRPVVVARLGEGALTLEVFGGNETGVVDAPGEEGAALEWAARHAGAVLVRVEPRDEDLLAANASFDRVSILTGADDAAVVACYRALKRLSGLGARDARIQLTVVGVEAEGGRLVHARIAKAARAFLEADLLEPVVVERVMPTRGRLLFRGKSVLTALTLAEAVAARASVGGSAEAVTEEAGPDRHTSAAGERDGDLAGEEAAPAGRSAEGTGARSESLQHSVAALVPGLRPLGVACPISESASLATDAEGALHVVVNGVGSLPAPATGEPARELIRVRSWVMSHAELVRLASGGAVRTVGDAGPRLHLLTDEASVAAALVETPVRVHLVRRADEQRHGHVWVTLNG